MSQTHTFKPSTGSTAKPTFSVGSIVEDARRELETRKRLQEDHERRQRDKEAQECTFSPRINEAPHYVTKIA